ncbi:ankyrin repeat domain-containing protein [Candidatus Babeliales bacterium]|nr:ankyrin repeat domain-containing protein [Candidatus Babeliales bacterium]MBP9843794.1 ankyrin repeat domain-containing protein [Candidatus Babeliales bacterium]
MKFKILWIVLSFQFLNIHAGPLHDAVRNNDLEQVVILVKEGVDVDSFSDYGYTALHIAACYNLFDIAKILIESGADIDIVSVPKNSSKERTSLQIAAQFNSFEVAQLLVHSGVNVKKNTWCLGWEPLELAIESNAVDIVKLLIPVTDYISGRMLVVAVQQNSYELVQLLIEAGADVNYDSSLFSVQFGYPLPDWVFVKIRKGITYTALHCAVEKNYLNIAALLIKSGAKKDLKGNNPKTPLELATTPEMRNVFKHFGKTRKKK